MPKYYTEPAEHWSRAQCGAMSIKDCVPDMAARPRRYLHVRDCRSGEEWVKPLTSRAIMDLATQARRWVKEWSGGAARLAGKVMSRVEGEFYAQLILNGDDPHSGRCWEEGGFFIETYQYDPGWRIG